jgi:hypothetical protein
MKPRTLALLSGASAMGLAALVVLWHGDAARAREDLERSKDEFRALAKMKSRAAELTAKNPKPIASNVEDLLSYLSAKSRQAGVPQGVMNITKNPDVTAGGWKEVSYTVTLRAAKDAPLSRSAFADFVRFVEDERPSVRSKSLALGLAGDGLSAATVTFSSFVR